MLTDCRRISYGLLKGFNSFLKLQNAFNDSAVLLKDDHKIYLN